MRQRSTMFRGNRMSFHPVATLGQVRMPAGVGQTYQDQVVENARYRLVAAQGQYDAARRAYEDNPSDQNFAALQVASAAVSSAQGQIAGTRDASTVFVQVRNASGQPLAGVRIAAFSESGRDLVVPGTPKTTGPGGRLELLLDSHAVEGASRIIIRPADAGDWTPAQQELDVSDFANSEVSFTQGAGASGAEGQPPSYSPFVLIGGLAVAAAIIYFATLD